MFLPAKVWRISHISKQQGTAGKHREVGGKGNAFHQLMFVPFCPVFFFHRLFDVGAKIVRCISNSIGVCSCGSLWHFRCEQTPPYFRTDSIVCNIGAEYRKHAQGAHYCLCLSLSLYSLFLDRKST